MIEHNLKMIKDRRRGHRPSPEGGDARGRIVAQGTPEQVASVADSYTGKYLRGLLDRRSGGKRGKVAAE